MVILLILAAFLTLLTSQRDAINMINMVSFVIPNGSLLLEYDEPCRRTVWSQIVHSVHFVIVNLQYFTNITSHTYTYILILTR